ncbi:HAD family hydrolase [Spirulina major CS-329]|uniref:HAD family hydrolase n=1 Tax=Spirulina TaxID=1154 RepID=UPI00232AEAEA|nr:MULTISPECIES: HAD family hydrolase [Spirulina]MDB9493711.1 HAD family hydrolase [Spirulina subsalsa CS-330]MDB9505134.1 HAD family hydrolase [Spirulina major CS-329]
MVTVQCGTTQFNGIEAIIFDKDGTLEHSANYLRELAQKRSRLIDAQIPGVGEPLLMAFGVQGDTLDPQGLMTVGSRKENEIAAAAYIAETGRSWAEARAIAHQAFEDSHQYVPRNAQTSPCFPGVRSALESLAATGIALGVLSAGVTAEVQEFVRYAELGSWLALELGHEDDGLAKPDPALYLKACQLLKVAPERTVMVGDSAFDWQMARAAGAGGVVGICWGDRAAVPVDAVDVAIASLADITIAPA